MAEKALLPINKTRLTAGYLNANYRKKFGFTHYGTDMVSTTSSRLVYAPFKMKILKFGYDRYMGNVIVAVSTDKIDIHAGKFKGERKLVVRMAHLASFHEDLKVGAIVSPEDPHIAVYGNTSGIVKNMGAHLHVELDTDTKYPHHSPTLAGSGNIWKAGERDSKKLSTVNPMDVFKLDDDADVGYAQTLSYKAGDAPYLSATNDRMTLDLDGNIKKATLIK